ncbi:VapC toxin family PIN domain ribonuclease [Treponema sp. OMZ 840]|uniref:type II toxin-antitoxin system VapC family toxin n=1 Tax=Treponema sp. OMZ 840 TaxID=244313 RepID=UPI003D8C1957
MILVDTSVLIDFFKGKHNSAVALFEDILDMQIPFGITLHIYQEVLQEAKDHSEFSALKEYLETIPFYELKHNKESLEKAALLNLECKEAGIIIQNSVNLITAQTAIENKVYLLHNHSDFEKIRAAVPALKIYKK